MPVAITVIVPAKGTRNWHAKLIARLRAAGHRVAVQRGPDLADKALNLILTFEALRFGKGMAAPTTIRPADFLANDLIVDLTGAAPTSDRPTLRVLFNGVPRLGATAATALRSGAPTISLQLDGKTIGIARPMVGERIWLTRALNDILVRAADLIVSGVDAFARGSIREMSPPALEPPQNLATAYWLGIGPKLLRRLWLKLRYKPFHWRVGYRFHGTPPNGLDPVLAAEPQWLELEEDGSRFYADPFPVEVDGRYYLFVEEFPHATAKGVISVAECGADGVFGPARVVLEEPFHLSYPQVFQHDGAFWMIPETAGGGDLYLYRAEQFPDRWVRRAVLVAGKKLSDATLLVQHDQFWLFAADGSEGSSSDAMLVFHAASLEGPYLPHAANPIVIDQTSARPAGAFIPGGQFPVLPVQNGSDGYGSGMGLVEVLKLNHERVCLGLVRPIDAPGWRLSFKHTINRAGRLEVIDGVVLQAR